MKVGRASLAALLAACLTACNGAGIHASPESTAVPAAAKHALELAAPTGTIREHRAKIRAGLPPGTRIYVVPTTEIIDKRGTRSLTGAVRRIDSSAGPILVDQYGNSVSLQPDSKLVSHPDGIEYYIRPGFPLPPSLANAKPSEVISGATH